MASNISTPAITPTPTPGPTTTTAAPAPAPAASSEGAPTTTTTTTTTTTLKIRPATIQDAEPISHLGTLVFDVTFRDSGCTPAQLQKFLDEAYSVEAIRADLQDPHKTTLVAVDGNDASASVVPDATISSSGGGDGDGSTPPKILGFALLNRGSSSSEPAIAPHYAKPVELQRLYVGLGSHGRGIGTALMNEAEGLARKEGWEHMWLGVWERNFRAQKVYGKLGYRRVGEHLFDVGGDPQWDWILVKELSPAT